MGRHRIDLVSLVFGILFVTIGGLFVFGRLDAADVGVRWITPSVLVVAGLLLAAVTLNRRQAVTPPPATAPPYDELEAGAGDEPSDPSDAPVTAMSATEPSQGSEPAGED